MLAAGPTAFGQLLRTHRLALGLTQEVLAERAELSVRGIQALERGVRGPQQDTLARLVRALDLGAERAAAFVAAGRPRPRETSVRDVGALRLLPTRLSVPEPSPEAGPGTAGRLPRPLTPLVGREREVAMVTQRLGSDGVRLLTLVGPGGVGKTRLALGAAEALRSRFVDGVVWVDLSALREPDLVLPTLARAVGLHQSGALSLADLLAAHLRDRHLLLVLDTFDQVVVAAPWVASVVADCPELAVLATSRVVLRVAGEQVWPVGPLALPATDAVGTDDVGQSPAVQLYLERARSAGALLELTAATAPTVARLCRRLDGLPLALELAAARARVLPPEVALARLERRLALLVGGPRDWPARQQTLRDTLAWSYALLEPAEQQLFRRLAVFAGGCTLAAVEAVCAGDGNPAETVLDLLSSLLDKSLLQSQDPAEREPRFAMLDTVREFAGELLGASGEAAGAHRAHAEHYLMVAEAAESELTGPAQAQWLARLEREHDNLRSALRWASDTGETERGLRLAGAIWRFWWVRGYLVEGRGWIEGLLDHDARAWEEVDGGPGGVPGEPSAAVRAKALNGDGGLAFGQGDYARATALYAESLALRRELGDARGAAVALHNLANVAADQGETRRAAELSEESLAVFRQVGDARMIAITLANLGDLARHAGDVERAVALATEALDLSRQLGDTQYIGVALVNVGHAACDRDEWDRGQAAYAEALEQYRTLGDGYRLGIAACLEGLAAVAADRQPRRAARWLGTAASLREAIGSPVRLINRDAYDRTQARTRAALGEQVYHQLWSAGRALALEQAVTEALEPDPTDTRAAEWPGSLGTF